MLNPYRQLLNLLPNPPLLVGQVTSYENGEATVTLPGGGTVRARGETTIGQRVFVRDSVIEGPAPNLTVEIINV